MLYLPGISQLYKNTLIIIGRVEMGKLRKFGPLYESAEGPSAPHPAARPPAGRWRFPMRRLVSFQRHCDPRSDPPERPPAELPRVLNPIDLLRNLRRAATFCGGVGCRMFANALLIEAMWYIACAYAAGVIRSCAESTTF